MIPEFPFMEFPPEKSDKILNTLACYGVVLPLSPRQIYILSGGKINTVRGYLRGQLSKKKFVKRERGFYKITKEGLESIQYPVCIEERIALLNSIKIRIEKEIAEINAQKWVIHSAWLKALENEIAKLHPNVIKQIEYCKKRSENWKEFELLLEASSEALDDFDKPEIPFAKRYIFDRAKKRIPFDIWKKASN